LIDGEQVILTPLIVVVPLWWPDAKGIRANWMLPSLSVLVFTGCFSLVLAKHSKSFSLIDCIAQRNFEPMRKQVEAWQRSELADVTAKIVIYDAFVEGKLEAAKHLARTVHDLYFEPLCFAKRNGSNAECIVTQSCAAHQTPIPIPR